MKALYTRLKLALIAIFRKKAIITVSTGKLNGIVTVNSKRTFMPAHSTIHYGVGITSDKATWPKV